MTQVAKLSMTLDNTGADTVMPDIVSRCDIGVGNTSHPPSSVSNTNNEDEIKRLERQRREAEKQALLDQKKAERERVKNLPTTKAQQCTT